MTAAWLVHLYTASGAVFAFFATRGVFEHRYRDAFFWLAVTVFVDATDGVLARLAKVSERLPWFSGAKLDDIVDYLIYVFVPALIVWRAILVPDTWSTAVVAAMLLSSAYGFNRLDAKTDDHYFTGFPSYWNIVVFYLYVAGWSPVVNGVILLTCATLVFVPIRYVYPSRTRVWRVPTLVLGVIWGVLMCLMLWRMPAVPRWLFLASLVFPFYYLLLSLALQFGKRRSGLKVFF
ncbi:MAG: CDP-diacylglycerol O-phosphatidyltransferase [Acidobacteria bacterium]|nr:CDP-diacylglycerol O-phosphatidyltransferase [Acidobacteriota bacterium]